MSDCTEIGVVEDSVDSIYWREVTKRFSLSHETFDFFLVSRREL
jgi:hypothetical protein